MKQAYLWNARRAAPCCVLFYLLVSNAAWGNLLQTRPQNGDYVVYYDISFDGCILEIDYREREHRFVEKVPLSKIGIPVLLSGWYIPHDATAFLLAHDAEQREDRLYLFEVESRHLLDTPIELYTGGDSRVLPISKDIVYVQDFEKEQSVVYHPFSGGTSHRFEFELRQGTPVSISSDRTYLLVGGGFPHDTILKIDAFTGRELLRYDSSSLIDGAFDSAFICFDSRFAIIRSAEGGGYRLQYADLGSHSLISSSSPIESWAYSDNILVANEHGHMLYCINLDPRASIRRPIGTVQRFVADDHSIRELPSVKYDAISEVFLLADGGEYVICDVKSFDYLSMSRLSTDSNWPSVARASQSEPNCVKQLSAESTKPDE